MSRRGDRAWRRTVSWPLVAVALAGRDGITGFRSWRRTRPGTIAQERSRRNGRIRPLPHRLTPVGKEGEFERAGCARMRPCEFSQRQWLRCGRFVDAAHQCPGIPRSSQGSRDSEASWRVDRRSPGWDILALAAGRRTRERTKARVYGQRAAGGNDIGRVVAALAGGKPCRSQVQ